jgi:hypothetical protein
VASQTAPQGRGVNRPIGKTADSANFGFGALDAPPEMIKIAIA